jgi:hypothetical protein
VTFQVEEGSSARGHMNNFVLWGCLSVSIGLVHFSPHSPVDEDPAKCVYRRQLI